MKLSPHEIGTPLWQKLQSHYEARLNELRISNDKSRPEDGTIKLRAQIQQIKEFLDMGKTHDPETEIAAD